MAWIRTKIPIRKKFNKEERLFIGQEIIDYIVERTKSGKDKNENPFPKYSKSYVGELKNGRVVGRSLDARIAGKRPGSTVNLTLSNEMLSSLDVLSHKKGEITIGFQREDLRNNGVAEGNIKGTYGKKTPMRGKKRDFLGITGSKKIEIQNKYDTRVEDVSKVKERISRLRDVISARTASEEA